MEAPSFPNEQEIATIRSSGAVYVDAFDRQLQELFFIDSPAYIGSEKAAAFATDDFKMYLQSKKDSYTHVYFPWNGHLVKTVSADDYFRLITNRNQDLITAQEQRKLYAYRVAVFGQSVGSNIAYALAESGISQEMAIADFDTLDTTNLNRIMAGVHEIGLNKCRVTARHVYEHNPFVHIRAFESGIDTDTLEQLLQERQLDCIIDEVDDMRFKLQARSLALQYRVPVVMVTDNGDGVVLHVERYDLGYDKCFGKEFAYFDHLLEGDVTKERAGKFIMEDIVGGADKVDPLMLASVQRVLARQLVSWSQLGSAALLGGVVATYAVKQVALGKDARSDIRAYIFPASGTWGTHAPL